MPITMQELQDGSRKNDYNEAGQGNDQAVLRYWLIGDTDETAIKAHIDANVPATYNGLTKKSVSIKDDGKPDAWRADVKYGSISPDSEGGGGAGSGTNPFERSLQISGGNTTILAKFALEEDVFPIAADKVGKAINLDANGVIQGVDIISPTVTFTERHTWPTATINDAYVAALMENTTKVNDAAWRGLPAGCVMFQTFNLDWTVGNGKVDIVYNFAYEPPIVNEDIAGIAGVNKDGWDVLWVRTVEQKVAGVIQPKTLSVHVNQVYPRINFPVVLQIG